MRLKYIITEHGNFALFSEGLESHNVIASRVFGKVVGAGFATIAVGYKEPETGHDDRNINVHCFGRSVSLDMDSRPEDEKIINDKLNDIYEQRT